MTWHFTPYAVPLYAGTGVVLVLVLIAWHRRKTIPGASTILFLGLASAVYITGYAFELSSTRLDDVKFWLRIEYIGVTILPVLLFFVVAYYTGNYNLARPLFALLVLPLPISTLIFAWTNDQHGLIWQDMVLVEQNGTYFLDFTPGFWYWVDAIYTWTLVPAGLFMVLRAYPRMAGVHRRQLQVFVLGLVILLVGGVIYLIGGPLNLDLYPYCMTLTTLLFGYSVLRYRFLDIMPVARAAVVSSMTDLVIVLDERRRVVDLNPAARQALKIDVGQAIGQPAAVVFEPWPVIVTHLAGSNSQGAEQIAIGEGECALYYDMRISPLSGARAAQGSLLVLRDITARVRAEADRERLIRSLDSFAHTVAHDIKSPLSVIVSYSLLLQEDWGSVPDAEAREYLEVMSNTGLQITSIVDSLLLFATVDELSPTRLDPVDMAPLIRHVHLRLRDVMEAYGARIEVAEEWPRGIGYAPWVEEVWMNYVSNAIKYGGKPPVVTLGAAPQPDGTIRYWVRDNGPGLTAEEQTRLFTAFTRLRQDRVDGHGLGLSIVQRIMEKLGGETGVESTPGQGSCFYFVLPAAKNGPR